MFFKNYEYFLAIADNGGLTRAAEALFISQPALSKYLSRLEHNLGIELFDHSSSPLKLTFAGQRYYEYIKRIQALDKQFQNELVSIKNNQSGEIRMGIAQWRGSMLLPVLIPAFQQKYPHVNIEVLEGRAMQIETALLQGKIDLCLMNLPSNFPTQTKVEVIMNERLLLVGNRSHPAVRRALETPPPPPGGYRNLDLRFLEHEHFIFLKPGQNLTLEVERLFAAHNLVPKSSWSTENMATALNMVSNSRSFTIMPEAGARSPFLPENLEFFSIGQPEHLWSFAAIFRKDYISSRHVQTLLDTARTLYAS